MTHPFDVATAVTHAGDDRWTAEVDPGWSAPTGPNGGYLASIVLRAMAGAVGDPLRAPRSITLHYLRPPAPGPADVTVAVERTGRTVTTLTARLGQGDRLCVLALASFALTGPSAIDYAEAPPESPPWEAVERRALPAGAPPIAHRLDLRPTLGPRLFSGAAEALTGGWLAFETPRAPDALALATYVDAWLPAPFTRLTGPIAAATIDLTIHFRHAATSPAPGPVLGRFSSRTSAEGFFEEDAEVWGADGVLLAQSRQLALARPL